MEKRECWWECKLVQSLWKTVWRFLRKRKIELPYDLAILYPNKTVSQRYMHTYVPSSTIHDSQNRKQPKCPLTDEMDKEDVVHIYNEALLSHKK